MTLSVHDLTFTVQARHILHGINLEVQRGETLALIGPSGSGKSTLLRLIAGLETPSSGDIRMNGQSILRIPTHRRRFSLMFQDYALFPHLNVAENIRFGLKMHRIGSRSDQMARVRELLDLVNLHGFEKRRVAKLSGGEQQRVALARCLAHTPELLMLDEPLGALDAGLRQRLIVEIKAIVRNLSLTTIYVTHDRTEALDIANRIAVLNEGRLEQVGTPTELYRQPHNIFVARFLGFYNIIPVHSQQGQTAFTVLGDFEVSGHPQALALTPSGLTLADPADAHAVRLRVHDRVFHVDGCHLRLRASDGTALELVTSDTQTDPPEIGDMVAVRVDPSAVIPLGVEPDERKEVSKTPLF